MVAEEMSLFFKWFYNSYHSYRILVQKYYSDECFVIKSYDLFSCFIKLW
jgi:hypothetical protein